MTRWIALALVWPVLAPGVAAPEALRLARLALLWLPQAQFAGYYVALDRGLYRKHGLDLSIISGRPGRSPAEDLSTGRAASPRCGSAPRRDDALPPVDVAQIVQRAAMALVARKSAGIRTAADLAGRKVGLWGGDFAIAPRAFFDRHGLAVAAVPQSATVNLFPFGSVAAASAMLCNEYHTLLNSGLDADELTVFRLDQDGLYALDSTVSRDPGLVDAFAAASLEGWETAFADPDGTLGIVLARMREARLPANRMRQRWMLARMAELVSPAATGELLRTGLLRATPDYDRFARPLRAP